MSDLRAHYPISSILYVNGNVSPDKTKEKSSKAMIFSYIIFCPKTQCRYNRLFSIHGPPDVHSMRPMSTNTFKRELMTEQGRGKSLKKIRNDKIKMFFMVVLFAL